MTWHTSLDIDISSQAVFVLGGWRNEEDRVGLNWVKGLQSKVIYEGRECNKNIEPIIGMKMHGMRIVKWKSI